MRADSGRTTPVLRQVANTIAGITALINVAAQCHLTNLPRPTPPKPVPSGKLPNLRAAFFRKNGAGPCISPIRFAARRASAFSRPAPLRRRATPRTRRSNGVFQGVSISGGRNRNVFDLGEFNLGLGPQYKRSPMEPRELFLASAVTGAAVLIEIGAFIVLGII